MEIAHSVEFMGAEPVEDYVTMLGSATGDSFLALAQIKLIVRQVAASVANGNCGAANEQMQQAWQQFSSYAPLAARLGQSSYARSMFSSLMAWETKVGRTCVAGMNPSGMLGAFSMDSVKENFQTHKKAWIIGGVVAALGVGALMLRD